METTKIKLASEKDIEFFWKFFNNSVKNQFPEYSAKVKNYFLKRHYTKSYLKRCVKNKTLDIIIALNGREPVGYLITNIPYGGVSYIIWLAVKNSFQKRGIGSLLLKKYEFVAKRRGIHKIHLWTSKRNLKFYKKNGYNLVGFIPKNYFGVDDWLFYKTIRSSKY